MQPVRTTDAHMAPLMERVPHEVEAKRAQEVAMLHGQAVIRQRPRPRALKGAELVAREVAAHVLALEPGSATQRKEVLGGIAARDRAIRAVGAAREHRVDVEPMEATAYDHQVVRRTNV